MTRPERCHGCQRWSQNRCQVLGWSNNITKVLNDGPCRWRLDPMTDPGFFDAYVARVVSIIKGHPNGSFKVSHVRAAQGCDTADRSNNQFLGKALRHLVQAGVIARVGDTYSYKLVIA